MVGSELCTASCMMKDGQRIVLGRTEKFGNGTTLAIWDIMGNEPVRKIKYTAAIGFADNIAYLNLSRDNRYVIAGFQNSYDGKANFLIFDLSADNFGPNGPEPKVIALDANADCTAILDNHQVVTGTRNGDLIIWSMKTGKPLRRLVSGGGATQTLSRKPTRGASAHGGEVMALEVSSDGVHLISASADNTLKVWDMNTEKHVRTLSGHKDEVCRNIVYVITVT